MKVHIACGACGFNNEAEVDTGEIERERDAALREVEEVKADYAELKQRLDDVLAAIPKPDEEPLG